MAANTFAKVATSLGDELLSLAAMTGHEALGRPFEYELDLFSLDSKISLTDLIAQPATVQLELKEGKYRFINGLVTRFACTGMSGRYTTYRATLRPWLWLLTRHTDCRIFQNKTVPEVIKEVFRAAGFSDFDENFGRSFRTWEYICQYRESTFNFVSRLMEQEGIYYYFKHEDGLHTLYMTDYYSGHEAQEGYEEIPYFPPEESEQRERDHIDGWRVTQEIQPGRFSLNDFDFKKPRANLVAAVNASHNKSDFEIYDYPGEYEEPKDGEAYNRVRMEQATSQYEIVEGQGNARGLVVGAHFVLTDCPRPDQNREYLVTDATFTLDTGAYESTHRTRSNVTYRVSFQALETNTPFRPARETPKPEVTGPQTAIVTGGAGDEIYTDQYGRVKVKFHWDRSPEKDQTSSCWVRVSQAWAGANWGAIHIPRVGQEVIVEFLEGDPDRPIITGRVYNASSMPPYTLPDNRTQSGIKSRSTKNGTQNNFNELRFEDKLGAEQVYVQAERNMDTLVKADETLTVGANRTKHIGKDETTTVVGNRTETVQQNETITINVNRLETVLGTETLNITGLRTETLSNAELVTIALGRIVNIGIGDVLNIGAGRMVNIGGADNLNVGLARLVNVGGLQKVNVSGGATTSIGGASTVDVGGSESVKISGDRICQIKGNHGQSTGGDTTVNAGKQVVIDAGDAITIKTGAASIMMKKNGDIVLKGKNIQIEGSGNVKAKASGNMAFKATKIGHN
jgi:type VI secretion system secreted protein VgrG